MFDIFVSTQMKKFLLLSIFSALMLGGCSEGISEADKPLIEYSFYGSTEQEPDAVTHNNTRITFDPTSLKYEWEKGDKVRLWYCDNGQSTVYTQTFQEPFVAENTGAQTRFTVKSTTAMSEGNKDYLFFYPQNTIQDGFFVTIGHKEADNSWSQQPEFEKDFNLMAAVEYNQPSLVDTQNKFSAQFEHLTTALRLFPKNKENNPALDKMRINKMVVEFPQAVVGLFKISSYVAKTTNGLLIESAGSKTLTINFPTPQALSTLTANDVLIFTAPFSLKQNEAIKVTIYAETDTEQNLSQVRTISNKGTAPIEFKAGAIRTLTLNLRNEFEKTIDLSDKIGNPTFAPIGTHDSKENTCDPYPLIDQWGTDEYISVERVRSSASRVTKLESNESGAWAPIVNSKPVIILENTYYRNYNLKRLSDRAAFMMYTNDVLAGYYSSGQPFEPKDIVVRLDAKVFFSGDQTKANAPLSISMNHISNSTKVGTDSSRRVVFNGYISADKAHTTAYQAETDYSYAYPNLPQHAWHRYEITIPAYTKDGQPFLTEADFKPNSDGSEAYIGFDLNFDGISAYGCCVYIKDVSFSYKTVLK